MIRYLSIEELDRAAISYIAQCAAPYELDESNEHSIALNAYWQAGIIDFVEHLHKAAQAAETEAK